jgi:hypothetical protein
MKPTEAEKEFIAIHRERIKLDWTDWAKEPFVTKRHLLEMSLWKATQLLADPRFEYCVKRDVLINRTMGDNDV